MTTTLSTFQYAGDTYTRSDIKSKTKDLSWAVCLGQLLVSGVTGAVILWSTTSFTQNHYITLLLLALHVAVLLGLSQQLRHHGATEAMDTLRLTCKTAKRLYGVALLPGAAMCALVIPFGEGLIATFGGKAPLLLAIGSQILYVIYLLNLNSKYFPLLGPRPGAN